jgi:peptidoglycan/LPS O-acetylase OafA/YrhL
MGYGGQWPVGLSAGVDIFFVISGFVMWLTTRTRQTTPLHFWWNRITRIVPLYWLVTTFMLSILLVAPSVMQTSQFDLGHVVASYLFVPALNPGKPAMEPLLFPGWTLNYEMFFYAVFGLFLTTGPRTRLVGTVAVLAATVALGAVMAPPKLTAGGFYSDSIILEFAFGIALGEVIYLRRGHPLLPRAVGWALFAFGLACLLAVPPMPDVPRVIQFGLPSALIVLGVLAIECDGGVREIRLLHVLGDASYSIYLTQLVSMAAFFVVWRKLHLDAVPGLLVPFCVLDVVVAAIGGLITYRFLERPLLAIFRPRRRVAGRTAAMIP